MTGKKGASDMADLTASIIVIACTGVAAALIFLLAGRRKQSKERALEDYCRANGYSCSIVREPLRVDRHVEGASFTLISSMVSQRLDGDTGSDGWKKSTQLTVRCTRDTPSFALGSVSAAGGWDRLPEWVKNAAVEKLANESGIRLCPGSARHLHTTGKSDFLLFEQTPGESRDAMQKRLSPLLDEWPVQHKLVIHSGPAEIRIHAADCFIQDAELLEKIIRLGAAAGRIS